MPPKYPHLHVGDFVIALKVLEEADWGAGPVEYARPGDTGRIVDLRDGYLPTITWAKSGKTVDCDPHDEFIQVPFHADRLSRGLSEVLEEYQSATVALQTVMRKGTAADVKIASAYKMDVTEKLCTAMAKLGVSRSIGGRVA